MDLVSGSYVKDEFGTAVSPPPALEVRNLSKSYHGKAVLAHFDLTLQVGEIHALVGQNGSGKSTLIKSLAGYHEPDPGSFVSVGGHELRFGSPSDSYALGCRFVHQDLGLVQSMSALDNLFLTSGFPSRFGSVQRKAAESQARAALQVVGLNVDLGQLVSTLGPADQTGLAVARALMAHEGRAVSVLVLDEPTATLPGHEVERLLAILRSTAAAGVAVIYVTHHLDEIPDFAHRVSVVRNGLLVGTWPATDVDRRQLVVELIGFELAAELTATRDIDAHPQPAMAALSVKSLRHNQLLDLSVDVRSGEIVGLYGLTGSGREDALGVIFGAKPRDAGTVTVGSIDIPAGEPASSIKHGMGYLPPDRKTLSAMLHMTARENLTIVNVSPYWVGGVLRKKPEIREAERWFDELGVEPADGESSILSTFSGGNQQKVLLAKWLRESPKVLLLDEPTQGVDVGAKIDVHRKIQQVASEGTAVLVSSTDVEELASLCTSVLILRNGRVAETLKGAKVSVSEINRSFHSDQATNASVIDHG